MRGAPPRGHLGEREFTVSTLVDVPRARFAASSFSSSMSIRVRVTASSIDITMSHR